MPAPVKTAIRAAVEAEAIAALRNAPRALSVDELYGLCTVAEDKPTLSRILSHMKVAGTIIRDADIKPGEPGGMGIKAKGARAVAAYRLPTEAELAGSPDQAPAPTFAAPPASVVASATPMLDKLSALSKPQATKSTAKAKANPAPTQPIDTPTALPPTLAEAIDAIAAKALAHLPDHALDDDGADPLDDDWASDVLAIREQTRDVVIALADQLIGRHPVYIAAREAARAAQRLADDYV